MAPDDDILTLDIDGWEGPLDLLLALARAQKVDLRQLSILALVEQYLAFIERARAVKLELAADYLVMAAWLAYLKSALLLPRDPEVQPDPEELALRLQLRLERLDAMREAGARLVARDRLGRDVFPRGAPEGLRTIRTARWQAEIFDLIAAYGRVSARSRPVMHVVADRQVMTLDAALERVSALLGVRVDWATIDSFLPDEASRGGGTLRRSALASSFPRRAGAGAAGAGRAAPAGGVRAALSQGGIVNPPDDLDRAVEAVLFAAAEPLTAEAIAAHVGADVRGALDRLEADYAGRGIGLVRRGDRWHFETAGDLAHLLRRDRPEPRRLSRAGLETLAIIAYHEPVSRAEIEAIRGVAISRGTLDVLMEAGWVRPAGRREVPGRPLTYATTVGFLAHFGLASRRDLPGIDDLRAAGLLDNVDLAFEALVDDEKGEVANGPEDA